jgi:hypothetical protein
MVRREGLHTAAECSGSSASSGGLKQQLAQAMMRLKRESVVSADPWQKNQATAFGNALRVALAICIAADRA